MNDFQPILAPSLLAANHANLEGACRLIERLGLSWAHFDVMDGHFVPNLSFGPQTLADMRKSSPLFFDTHLMLDNPHLYIETFIKAGAGLITIHCEPSYDVAGTLARIRSLGCQCGIALNPGTSVREVEPFLEMVDLVLPMTVQPGHGGQAFRKEVLPKIAQIAHWRKSRGLKYRIQVDGGVDLETAPLCRAAGADIFVAGSAFFKAPDPAAFAQVLMNQVRFEAMENE